MEVHPSENNDTLIALTAEIVSAHTSHNSIPANDVPGFIKNIYSALASLTPDVQAEEAPPEPAVSIRSSVKRDHLVCLDCGKKMKVLRRHLGAEHDMSPEEYRAKWNLAADYPMTAADYTEMRRNLAKKIGLGKQPGQRRGRRKKAA